MYNGHDSFSYTSLECHYTISLLLLLQWIHSKDALRHRAAYIQWRTHTLTTISTTLSEKNVHMKTWCTGEYMTKLIRTCWNGTSSDTSACSMFLLWPWRKKKNAQIQSSEAWSATIYIIFFHNARQINCENRMMLHFSVSIKQHKEKKTGDNNNNGNVFRPKSTPPKRPPSLSNLWIELLLYYHYCIPAYYIAHLIWMILWRITVERERDKMISAQHIHTDTQT